MSNEKFKLITGSLLKVNDKPVKHVQKKQCQSKFLILAGNKLKLQKENKTKKLTQKQKELLIAELLQTSEGRQRLAESLIQPLRLRRDYTSFARNAFTVQSLPEGAIHVFDNSSALSSSDLSSS
jgi:hypothetical protein